MKHERAEQLIDCLEFLDSDLIEESYFDLESSSFAKERCVNSEGPSSDKKRRKKIPFILLVAVFILSFGMLGVAADRKEWSIDLLNYIGVGAEECLQLESGMVQLKDKDCQKVTNGLTGLEEEITFWADSSIGDQKNAYVLIKTNIPLPEKYNETTDYLYADFWNIDIREKKNGLQSMMGGSLSSQIQDGYLWFMMELHDVDNLNRSYVHVEIGDIYLAHDRLQGENDLKVETEPKELVYAGKWTMDWKYTYKSNAVKTKVKETFTVKDKKVTTKEIILTPLEIRVIFKNTLLDPEIEMEKIFIQKVKMKDGSTVNLSMIPSGSGQFSSRKWFGLLP